MKRIIQGLGFQISAAFLLLILLFGGASLHALGAFQRQIAYGNLLDMAARLALTAEQMHVQAMNYKQNAPRDYPTYYRDVRLYYQDLMAHMAVFDTMVDRFMDKDFSMDIGDMLPWIRPRVGRRVAEAVSELEGEWASYRNGLGEALGNDQDEPRLEWAAEYALGHHAELARACDDLVEALRTWSATEHRRLTRGAFFLIIVATVLPILLLLVLRQRALQPLRETIAGFQRVAEGELGHLAPVTGTTEARELTESFNRLSSRLDLLHRMLDRLQRGNDLDELVGLLSRDFSALLGFDWLGVVSVDETRSTATLETARLDAGPVPDRRLVFALRGTVIETALSRQGPLQVPTIESREAGLVAHLADLGMRDAMLLPLNTDTPSPLQAVVCFASRSPDRYDPAGGRLLGNIAQLLALSFGRTARLAEQTRLAAVGELASGIAHELRSPLGTITLALEHISGQQLGERSRRRLDLATRACDQMGRLLEDLLLYVKPVGLDLAPMDLAALLREQVAEQRELGPGFEISLEIRTSNAWILGDKLRLHQVLSNLTSNAVEAAAPGSTVHWTLATGDAPDSLRAAVRNHGAVIPPQTLARLPTPFYTTKREGTGLGLAIAKRLVERHGGRLVIRSEPGLDTEVSISFPVASMPAAQRHLASPGRG